MCVCLCLFSSDSVTVWPLLDGVAGPFKFVFLNVLRLSPIVLTEAGR